MSVRALSDALSVLSTEAEKAAENLNKLADAAEKATVPMDSILAGIDKIAAQYPRAMDMFERLKKAIAVINESSDDAATKMKKIQDLTRQFASELEKYNGQANNYFGNLSNLDEELEKLLNDLNKKR
jgi:methyl-accepting chemotaxis protein